MKNCENLSVDKRTKPTVANIAETVSSTSSFSLNEYYEQRSLLHPPLRSNVEAAKTWIGEREARACDTEKNTPNYIENIIILCRFIKLFCRYISHMLSRTKERRTIEAVRRGWDWVGLHICFRVELITWVFLRHVHNNSHSSLAAASLARHTLTTAVVNINETLTRIMYNQMYACMGWWLIMTSQRFFLRFLPALITCALWFLCYRMRLLFPPQHNTVHLSLHVRYFVSEQSNDIIFFKALPLCTLLLVELATCFNDKWCFICNKNDVNSIIDVSRVRLYWFYTRLTPKELIIHSLLEFGLKKIYLNKFISFFIRSNRV